MQDNKENQHKTDRKLFLILTASNEVYDDNGEHVSIEKMTQAANARHKQVIEYLPSQSEDDVISDYRNNPDTRFTRVATLVNLKFSKNSSTFFVESYRNFSVDIKESIPSTLEEKTTRNCCSIL